MPKPKQTQKQLHTPVLLEEVLDFLQPKKGEAYLDLTAGYGGHSAKVLESTKNPTALTLVDRDERATEKLQKRFKQARIMRADFASAARRLLQAPERFDMILADLGVSSPHLETLERGFSIKGSGPLDMRMDQSQKLDAYTVINSYSQKQLAKILKDYGQEPKARQIAAKIVVNRPLKTTEQLAAIARSAWPGHSRVHPATRTFQAIRLVVNDELNQLSQVLPLALRLLKPGGRLVVISFHSLEDRIVKNFLAENSGGYDSSLELLTKKPVVPRASEIVTNPRARSAKLRAAAKINTKRKE